MSIYILCDADNGRIERSVSITDYGIEEDFTYLENSYAPLKLVKVNSYIDDSKFYYNFESSKVSERPLFNMPTEIYTDPDNENLAKFILEEGTCISFSNGYTFTTKEDGEFLISLENESLISGVASKFPYQDHSFNLIKVYKTEEN